LQHRTIIAGVAVVAVSGLTFLALGGGAGAGGGGAAVSALTITRAAERGSTAPPVARGGVGDLEIPPAERLAAEAAAPGSAPVVALDGDQGELTVLVHEEASRRPLAGVRLVVYEPGAAVQRRSVDSSRGGLAASPLTDGMGLATFDLPAGRPLRLAVRGESAGASSAALVVAPLVRGEQRRLEVALATGGRVDLRGRLLDRETGEPIAGAEIRVRRGERLGGEPQAWCAPGSPDAASDAAGWFHLAPRAHGVRGAQVDAVGYSPALFHLPDASRAEEEALVVSLSREASLRVRIDSPDVPSDALALRVSAGCEELAVTDGAALGGAELEWLAPVAVDGGANLYHLPAHASLAVEVLSQGMPLTSEPTPLVLAPGEVRELEIDLGAGSELLGTLTDPDGRALAGKEVWLVPANHAGPISLASRRALASVRDRARTDSSGDFRFERVPSGDWWVGPAPTSEGDALAPIARWLHLPEDAEEVRVAVRAQPGLHLSGRVVDSTGTPVPDARLWLRALGGEGEILGTANETGHFRLGPLAAGPHELAALAEERPRRMGSEVILVSAGDQGVEVALHPGETIRVVGLLEEGGLAPLEAAFLTRLEGREPVLAAAARTTTGARALELTPLEPGASYTLVVVDTEGRVGIRGDVTVAPAEVREVQVHLTPGARLHLSNASVGETRVFVLHEEAIVASEELEPNTQRELVVPEGASIVRSVGEDGAEGQRRVQARLGVLLEVTLPL